MVLFVEQIYSQTFYFTDQLFAYLHNKIFKLQIAFVDQMCDILLNIRNWFWPEHSNE